MRGRLSSKQGRIHKVGGSMDIDKVDKVKEEPHLSGAYIRSLVKHLTSTRTKDPLDGDGGLTKSQNKNGECFGDANHTQQQPPPTPPPPQHKKQVRRRLHTSRPYQQRLLNMAEARREIVTALKFHRASMKHQEAATANNHDLQSPQTHPLQLEQSPPPQPSLGKSKSKRNSTLYPSTATATATANTNISNNFLEPYSSLSCPPPVPNYWPISTIAPPPPPLCHEDLNFPLPNRTLGLNLNFQNFNLDTNIYHNPLSMYSSSSISSSPSTSSSAAISVATKEVAVVKPKEAVVGDGLHHAMDDEEMEEIRSLGEQHQMEWNDTINLVTSARWCKFLKTMETGPGEGKSSTYEEDVYDGFHSFDQAMEFPPWLINANETSSLQQHFPDAYLQDPALPCMDIGEIEGIDEEWLA